MNGRTTVVILLFWAVLTIVTPILVRLSALATKPTVEFQGMMIEETKAGLKAWLPRRALVGTAPPQPPLPPLAQTAAPKMAPEFGINKVMAKDYWGYYLS